MFDAASGAERGRDADYGDSSYSVDFSADSRRLVSTSNDGKVRTYAVGTDGGLALRKATSLSGGQQPFAARYAPDGRLIAVGLADSRVVQVLDAQTLAERLRPDVAGVDNGNLGRVAWSADGRSLIAGGHWQVNDKALVRRWRSSDGSRLADVPLADNTVMDLVPLPAAASGGWLFAAADPAWGVLDEQGRVLRRQDAAIADLRGQRDELRLAADARQVRFGYRYGGADAYLFDLGARSLVAEAQAKTDNLRAADRSSLPIKDWEDDEHPTLNGQALPLETYETSRSFAISPDGQRFLLGTEWWLRLFNRTGAPVWQRPVPGIAWAVNVSADGRFVVAGYADGTIRWHRISDGEELLAFFAHADRRRWIAWTPEGFYAASGADAEELIGDHLNQGRDREGRFVSARQLREAFYQPHLVSRRLDADGDALVAEATARLGDVNALLAQGDAARTPSVEIVSVEQEPGEEAVSVRYRVRDEGGGIGGVVFYVDDRPQQGVRQAGAGPGGELTRTFALPPGRHNLAVAGLSRALVEGPRKGREVAVAGAAQPGALHILAVGVQRYRDPALALGHSVADARDVARELAQRAAPLFARGVPTPEVLVDEQATLAGIAQAFERVKARMQPQDTLVIFLAGHGEAPIGANYTFLPWDFRRSAAGGDGQGLDEKRLRTMLQASPPRTLLLLDTCDAGAAVDLLEDSLQRLRDLAQMVVIGAARRGEFAKEGVEGHGVFSAALLRVQRAQPGAGADPRLRVDQLAVAVADEVQRIVREWQLPSGQRVRKFIGAAEFPVLMR